LKCSIPGEPIAKTSGGFWRLQQTKKHCSFFLSSANVPFGQAKTSGGFWRLQQTKKHCSLFLSSASIPFSHSQNLWRVLATPANQETLQFLFMSINLNHNS
jgi:hypothetical protein